MKVILFFPLWLRWPATGTMKIVHYKNELALRALWLTFLYFLDSTLIFTYNFFFFYHFSYSVTKDVWSKLGPQDCLMVEDRSQTVLQECLQKRAYGKTGVTDLGGWRGGGVSTESRRDQGSLNVPKILKLPLNVFVSGWFAKRKRPPPPVPFFTPWGVLMQACLEHKTGTTRSLPEYFEDVFFPFVSWIRSQGLLAPSVYFAQCLYFCWRFYTNPQRL